MDFEGSVIVVTYAKSEKKSKSITGRNMSELIDRLSEIRDGSFIRKFYADYRGKLSEDECERVRKIIITLGDIEEIFEIFKTEDVSHAKCYEESFLNSNNYGLMVKFVTIAHDFIDCKKFEDTLFNCDFEDKWCYLAELSCYPQFNKDRIREALFESNNVEALIDYYKNNKDFDLNIIIQKAIESQNARNIYLIAEYIANNYPHSFEDGASRLEKEFLLCCKSSDLADRYYRYVGFNDVEAYVSLMVLLKGEDDISIIFKWDIRSYSDRKKLYKAAMRVGTPSLKREIKRYLTIGQRLSFFLSK